MVLTGSAYVAVLRRPSLWVTAVGALFALARRDWWRRPPFLPVPDPEYVRWRLGTAYGWADRPIAEGDVVSYLEWRKRQRSLG